MSDHWYTVHSSSRSSFDVVGRNEEVDRLIVGFKIHVSVTCSHQVKVTCVCYFGLTNSTTTKYTRINSMNKTRQRTNTSKGQYPATTCKVHMVFKVQRTVHADSLQIQVSHSLEVGPVCEGRCFISWRDRGSVPGESGLLWLYWSFWSFLWSEGSQTVILEAQPTVPSSRFVSWEDVLSMTDLYSWLMAGRLAFWAAAWSRVTVVTYMLFGPVHGTHAHSQNKHMCWHLLFLGKRNLLKDQMV